MEERYVACVVLHALGDTIGFKNGEWELKVSTPLEKLYQYIELGGVNHVPQKSWQVSDDTILQIKTAQAILEDFDTVNKLGEILTDKYIEAQKQFISEGLDLRFPGIITMKSIEKLVKKQNKWDNMPYDLNNGGSGASMRTHSIGLAYHKPKDRYKLIQIAIESSRITHNSVIGYLGGLTTAFFTALAVENVSILKWPHMLIELLTDGTVETYIKKSNRGYEEYQNDAHIFIDKWQRYIQDKFDDKGQPIKRRTTRNLVARTEYYKNTFAFTPESLVGSGGDDSVIIAYDCLLDANNKWETLVVYAMLHGGDTDTTGAIAAGWYGALNGFTDVPKNSLDNLEAPYGKQLVQLGKELYAKYHN
jgi:ADP-ribosylarginine hydrolase